MFRSTRAPKSRFVKGAITSIAVALALYVSLSIFGAVAAMTIPRLPLKASPSSVSLTYEDISFTSRDDTVVLRGWFMPGERNIAIIIVHGGFQNRVDDIVDTLNLARDLAQKGYPLLLFDLRGRGESDGRGRSLSNIDRDIGGAVDYLKSRGYSAGSIGFLGFCSGAASAVIFASQEQVGGLVLNSCFASVRDMVDMQAAQRHIPKFLLDSFLPGVILAARAIYGYQPVNPIDVIDKVTCPILFIHEEYDDLTSLDDTYRLLRASLNPANELLWEVSGTRHSEAYKTNPPEYISRVNYFFSRIEAASR